jgi:hypothetical protein
MTKIKNLMRTVFITLYIIAFAIFLIDCTYHIWWYNVEHNECEKERERLNIETEIIKRKAEKIKKEYDIEWKTLSGQLKAEKEM